MIILTFWVCLSTAPFCTPEQDPTGPPITKEFDTRLECEEFIAAWVSDRALESNGNTVPRHTCAPKGQDL